jgi:hypothetical protein
MILAWQELAMFTCFLHLGFFAREKNRKILAAKQVWEECCVSCVSHGGLADNYLVPFANMVFTAK